MSSVLGGQAEQDDKDMPPGFLRRGPRPAEPPAASAKTPATSQEALVQALTQGGRAAEAKRDKDVIASYARAAHVVTTLLPANCQEELALAAFQNIKAWHSKVDRAAGYTASQDAGLVVAAAIVAALRPGVAGRPAAGETSAACEKCVLGPEEILKILVPAALGLQDDVAACWLGAATASLLNKCTFTARQAAPVAANEASQEQSGIDAAADFALSLAEHQAARPTDDNARTLALRLLGLCAWGLAQLGHAGGRRAVNFAIMLLRGGQSQGLSGTESYGAECPKQATMQQLPDTRSGANGLQQAVTGKAVLGGLSQLAVAFSQPGCSKFCEAALVLDVLLSGPTVPYGIAHTNARILWQQRAFTQALQECQASLGHGKTGRGNDEEVPAVLLGLGRLVRGAPSSVVSSALQHVLPLVLKALRVLPASGLGQPDVLTSLLMTVSEAIIDPKGKTPLEPSKPCS